MPRVLEIDIEKLPERTMKEKHEKLRKNLIQFFTKYILAGGRICTLEKETELMEFANCVPADLCFFSDELDKFDLLSLAFADLHYRLQKENPDFRCAVSFQDEFSKDIMTIVRPSCDSDLALSSSILTKIQFDAKKNEEENHQKIGESLRMYCRELVNNDISEELWGLKIKTLKMYAGLPVSADEDVLIAHEMDVLQFVLEITERIFLLKAEQVQSKTVETNNSGLLNFLWQPSNPSLINETQYEDAKDKIKFTNH